ncbi:M42 family metallopeptidase [Mesomycoplasma conjunctivae]|uniref:M42 family metallopeptidase n=1 Tax=Mesomycoplasma conjunctivae TaxID=45361 RepID=UPI003DA2BF63
MDKKKINYDNLYNKLKQYTEIDGMSGFEEDVVKQIKQNTSSANVEFQRDGIGSLIIEQKNKVNGPKVVIAAHMDEIGYVVLDITEQGFIKVRSMGGIWGNAVIGAKVKLITSTDKEFYGVIGHTSVHIMEAEKIKVALQNKDLYIDFGFKNKQEAIDAGVEPGDRIHLQTETFRFANNDYVAGKAIDNRSGVVVIDELINRIANKKLTSNPIIVATAQEEVGTRGARVLARSINADIAFAIDTGAAHDTEGAIPGIQKLGAGVSIDVMDGGLIGNPRLIKLIFKIAKEKNIPVYKYVSQGGGTDAEELQYLGKGTPTVSISIPQRYLHSTYGVVSLHDIEAAIDLIEAFLTTFDNELAEEIRFK